MALSKKPVTGMKDILPAEMEIRDYCISVIKDTYAKFGFTSIETPCVENIANLTNKQGGDNEKLIFKILKRGEKLNLEKAQSEADLVANARCGWAGTDELYIKYHDEEWGKPVTDDKTSVSYTHLDHYRLIVPTLT